MYQPRKPANVAGLRSHVSLRNFVTRYCSQVAMDGVRNGSNETEDTVTRSRIYTRAVVDSISSEALRGNRDGPPSVLLVISDVSVDQIWAIGACIKAR